MGPGDNSKEYIDVDDALKRVGGNLNLYKKLLGRYIEGNHMSAFDDALASGNMEEAAHLAHTIKGVSANLSLIKVMNVAADFEQAVKNGGDSAALLEELKQAYNTTVEKIAEVLG